LVAAAVTAGSIALVATPAADAKISKPERAQNTAIKKASKNATSAGKSAKAAAKVAAKGVADAKAAQGGVNGIVAQVPSVLDGLTKLAAGLQQAADGLTKLGANAAAQEYGVVKVQLGTTDAPGAILTSSDIPDDSNAAVVTGTMLVSVPASTTAAPVRLLAGVRSGESDGTGATDPVASAGIVTMSVGNPTSGLTISGGNTVLPAAVPITSAPNGVGGPPVYPIPNKAPRVDATPNPFSFPTALAIDLTDPATLQNLGGGVGPFLVTNPSPTSPLPMTVTVTVRFNDLTASATDVTA
jgi:X-X-X-Leu-X-X-Gly heptad repeat protein